MNNFKKLSFGIFAAITALVCLLVMSSSLRAQTESTESKASFSGGTWGGDDTTLALNSTSFPNGNIFNDNAQFAMSDWNAVVGSNFKFFVKSSGCSPTNTLPTSDNCVAFVSGSSISGALGLTNWVTFAGTLLDANVRFNVDVGWVAGLGVNDFTFGPPFSFRGVARHEFGHALGLCHEDRTNNVVLMNSIYTPGGVKPANPHWDGRLGLRTLYPSSGSERDLIAYMWKKTTNDVQGCNSSSTNSVPVNTLPSTVRAGSSLSMQYSFENAGNLSTSGWGLGFYLSSNTTISTGDTLLSQNTGASAGAHSRGTFLRTLTIPANTPPGSYSLGVCVDHLGQVSESREGNNCERAPGSVTVTSPDLIVNSFSVNDTTLGVGQTFTASANVRNSGSSFSSSSTLRYYRSTNSTISTFDTQLATDGVVSLNVSGNSAESATVSIPSAGTYWIGACVDSVTPESNTGNNCSTGVQVTVSPSDLRVINPSISIPWVFEGQAFTIASTVRNYGSGVSPSTTLRYYRSTNSTISGADTLLTTDFVGGLNPSASSPESGVVSIPTEGNYWVGSCVDAVNGETSTANNCSTGIAIQVIKKVIFEDDWESGDASAWSSAVP